MPFCLLMRTAKEMFELVTKVNLRRCFLWWYFLAEMKSQLLERGLTLELYKQNSFLCLIMLDVVVASTKVTRITYNIFNSIVVYVFGIIQWFETWLLYNLCDSPSNAESVEFIIQSLDCLLNKFGLTKNVVCSPFYIPATFHYANYCNL